jgi:hypothetical protein
MFIQEGKGDKVQNTGFSGGSSKLRPNFLKGGNFKYKNSLPSKHESLSSSPSATKKKKRNEFLQQCGGVFFEREVGEISNKKA